MPGKHLTTNCFVDQSKLYPSNRFFFEFLLDKPDLLSQLRPLYVSRRADLEQRETIVSFQWSRSVQQSIAWLFDLLSRLWERENETKSQLLAILFDVSHDFDPETVVRRDGIFRWTESSARVQRSVRIPSLLDQSIHGSTIGNHFIHLQIPSNRQSQPRWSLSVSSERPVRMFIEGFPVALKVQRISKAFNQLIEQQIERRRRKIETPRFVLERVLHELNSFQKQLQDEPNRW